MRTGRLTPRTAWPAASIALIGLVALALRLVDLTSRSLWLDEIRTSLYSGLGGPADVFTRAAALVNQMPLYYLVVWALHPFGDGPLVLRLPAAIFGTLAVLAVFLVGHRMFGPRVAVVGALLTALSPYAVWYSQEARTYSLFMLLTTVQMYFAYRAATRGRPVDWVGLAVLTVLNLYTHYFAIAATAAAAAYVGAFLARDAARALGPRVSLVAGGILGVAAVALGLVGLQFLRGRISSGLGLGIAAALLLTLAAGYLWLRRARLDAHPETRRRVDLGVITAVVTAAFYAPWLPQLHTFLSRPDQTVERLPGGSAASVATLLPFLDQFGLTGVALAGLVIGLAVLVAWLWTPRAAPSLMVLAWLAIPLAGMAVAARGKVLEADPRYFVYLFPAAALAMACGVEGIATLLARAAARLTREPTRRHELLTAGATAVLMVPLLVQALPVLAANYTVPKNDYRAAATHIAANSPPGSAVVAMGLNSSWADDCFHYYLGQLGARVPVVDAHQVDSGDVPALAGSAGTVWGVVLFPTQAELASLNQSTAVKLDFVDVTNAIYLIRAQDATLTPSRQAQTVMRWELPADPALIAPIKLLEWIDGQATLGDNLVSVPGDTGWSFDRGSAVSSDTVVIKPDGAGRVDAKFMTPIKSDRDFLLRVACTNTLNDRGVQRVFALALDSTGATIGTYPDGGGAACASAQGWTTSYFVFDVPPNTAAVKLVLRAGGRGTAEFESLELRSLIENS